MYEAEYNRINASLLGADLHRQEDAMRPGNKSIYGLNNQCLKHCSISFFLNCIPVTPAIGMSLEQANAKLDLSTVRVLLCEHTANWMFATINEQEKPLLGQKNVLTYIEFSCTYASFKWPMLRGE